MKKRVILLLFAVLQTCLPSFAAGTIYEEDGIRYELKSDGDLKEATIVKAECSGDVVIPESVNGGYVVRGMSEGAFANNVELTSLSFPSELRISADIPSSCFYNCPKLEAFKVDSKNPYYFTIDGVLFYKENETVWELAVYPLARKEPILKIQMPDIVGISLQIHRGVCYEKSPYLKYISVRGTGATFHYGDELIVEDCPELSGLVCVLNTPTLCVDKGSKGVRPLSEAEYVNVFVEPTGFFESDHCIPIYDVKEISKTRNEICFSLKSNMDDKILNVNSIYYYITNVEKENVLFTGEENGVKYYKATNLFPNEDEDVGYYFYALSDIGFINLWHISTLPLGFKIEKVKETQTKAYYRVLLPDDPHLSDLKMDGKSVNFGDIAIIDGMYPHAWYGKLCTLTYTINGKTKDYIKNPKGQTRDLTCSVSEGFITPTSVTVRGIRPFDEYSDAVVSDCILKVNGQTFSTDEIELDDTHRGTPEVVVGGLDPDTEYTVDYTLMAGPEGRAPKEYTAPSKTVKTGTLTWDKPEATPTSTSSVRLMVTTNCGSDAGFEWRRIDAPELVPSNKVACPVVDGMLVGSLRNVNPETYYKCRPFYTSASGRTYYGDWVGFYTGDAAVYFEPEVRTFAASPAADNSVTLSGYALAGTDDIEEQGFEYWRTGGAAKVGGTDAGSGDVTVVNAGGIKMNAALSDLQYNSAYAFRAFAKTSKGMVYGETMTFVIGNPSGVESVAADAGLSVMLRNNPVSGTAYVRCVTECRETAVYRIVGVNGATVSAGELEAADDWQGIDVSHCPAGLYFLNVQTPSGICTQKLIVK